VGPQLVHEPLVGETEQDAEVVVVVAHTLPLPPSRGNDTTKVVNLSCRVSLPEEPPPCQ
jgi:hypothetical protein